MPEGDQSEPDRNTGPPGITQPSLAAALKKKKERPSLQGETLTLLETQPVPENLHLRKDSKQVH
jgi:hypothetical protein